MAQYIDKDALVAELKKSISLFQKEKKIEKWSIEASQTNVISLGARIAMLEEILSFINTLEVKEADLDKEKDDYWNKLCDSAFVELLEIDAKLFDDIAKHFFELGLKAQKGEWEHARMMTKKIKHKEE